ncbi:hypothetical protein CHLNCDRAFT_57252 [Chlorella variabilis]|uniref:Uncharacterized protein n=1 Tax=Chlorella variabilis TaxID=554065 RepID=E1Z960_CHLVA|nr:hypothetical protein CHLNCDRAFT_57252 [Chlorella variabilis]EFN57460.1 hypothetical protein CHLNCDRAFT_57252 [Chlorella variabilis]|eukprot:XP_005849562.1 hypothetical protein CHLNCDRAFT_57252 [Chlorella variabilis]
MFKDDAFQVRSTVDKRGRKVKGSKKNEDMRRYYRLQGEEQQRRARDKERAAGGEGGDEQVAAAVADQRQQHSGRQSQKQQERKQQGKQAAGSQAKLRRQVAPGNDAEASSSEEEMEDGEAQKAALQTAGAEAAGRSSGSESEPASDAELADEEQAAQERWARMRGLAGPEASSDEEEELAESSSEFSDEEEDGEQADGFQGRQQLPAGMDVDEGEEPLNEADLEEWGVGALAANPEEPILMQPDATPRLAAVDLDWEHVRAVDILAVLRSFVPQGGAIRRVVVHPSDYGLERMAQEAVMGPQGIFKPVGDSQKRRQVVGVEDDGESEGGAGPSSSESDEGGQVDQRRLRLYERSKLRYYYAIITCDSAATANRLYEECDGMELMKTACKFDLRFVPEEQSFEGRQVRDEATDVPTDYAPPTFQARALQHTNVQLTWDTGDDGRKRALTRRVTAEELKEDDFKAYLATDSEAEDGEHGGIEGEADEEDEEAIRERYRRLLLGGGVDAAQERQGKRDWGGGSGDDEGSEGSSGSDSEGQDAGRTRINDDKGMEMEVTFLPGLENLGKRVLARKQEEEARKGETVWDAYMRRRREKRAEAKRKGRRLGSDESDSDYDDAAGRGSGSGSEEEADASAEGDPFFQPKDDPFDDPFFQDGPDADAAQAAELAAAGKRGKRQEQQQHQERKGKKGKGKGKQGEEDGDHSKWAELEMLLMDDASLLAPARGGGMLAPAGKQQNEQTAAAGSGKLSKKERMRLKKEARRRERQEGSDDEDAAAGGGGAFRGVDLADPRFADLLTSHHFALDPTDPRFKDTSAGVATAVAKRRSQASTASGSKQQKHGQQQAAAEPAAGQLNGSSVTGKADLKFLVASLKRKTAPIQGGGSKPAAAASSKPKKKKKKV